MKKVPSNRRQFIRQAAITGTALGLLPLTNIACMFDPKSPYLDTLGLQLWSVRNQLEQDAAGTLKSLANMGYRQVELMDVRQLPTLKPIADDLGLAVNSSFMLWTTITGNWDAVPHETDQTYSFDQILEDAKGAGLDHLVFGYLMKAEREKIDDYKKICDQLNQAGEKAAAAGIQLCYHNHSFEFGPLDGEVPFEVLIERLDPQLVQFELDIFWASLGGYDPLELTNRLGKRVRLLHLKDKLKGASVNYDEGTVDPGTFKELGNGEIDIRAIVQAGEKNGVKYCFVEQDHSPDPINSVTESIEFMRQS